MGPPITPDGFLTADIPNVQLVAFVPSGNKTLSHDKPGKLQGCLEVFAHSTVLMLKPNVGEIVSTASPLNLKKQTEKHKSYNIKRN